MKLDSVGTCGSSTQNTRSKSIHPDVKRILSFHLKKKIPFRKGIRESLFIKKLKAAVKIKNLSNIQKQHNNMKNHNNFKSKI
jgi:hypothetical protein